MSYQISRDGKELGTFTEAEVLEGVEDGSILPTDHLWTDGMDDWVLVETLIEEDEEAAPELRVEDSTVHEPESEPEPTPASPPVRKFTKVVVPVVSPRSKPAEAPAPPKVIVVAPSAAPPQPQYVSVPPSIMPGQYGVAGEATASLVFGILSLLCLCFTALPAVVYGHLALSRIRRSGRAYGGEGLAIAGMVLGYFFIVISILMAVSYSVIASVFAPLIEQAVQRGG